MSLSNNEPNFYARGDLPYIEKAILLNDIALPILPKFPSHGAVHYNHVKYPRSTEAYSDETGYFSIPILTPMNSNNTSKASSSSYSIGTTTNITSDGTFKPTSFDTSNYITLTIPKYIVLNFLKKIPAGTEFMVAFIGGQRTVDSIKIIGVCP